MINELLVWKVRAESMQMMLQVSHCLHSLKQNVTLILDGS